MNHIVMNSPIHITAIRNEPADLDRFVAALLALAIARVEAERAGREAERAEDGNE